MAVDWNTVLIGQLTTSFLISGLLSYICAGTRHHPLTRKGRTSDLRAVQASHIFDVPRLGGLAIFSGFMTAMLSKGTMSQEVMLMGSGLIVFVVGIWEDISGDVSAQRRLIASMVAAAAAMYMSGAMITRLDLPTIDFLLVAVPAIAVCLTILLSAAYTHAFNLIDGMNGLSATVGISSSLALAWTAHQNGQSSISATMILLAAAICGFALLNWPRSRIFLGDGGAYFIGHVLFWSAVLLARAVPEVNIASIILIMFWPVAELTTTILRRLISGTPLGKPDRLHFHQIVRRGIEIATEGRQKRSFANAMTTVCLLPAIIVPTCLGAVLARNGPFAALALVFYAFLYTCSYIFLRKRVARHKARRRIGKLRRSSRNRG